MIGSLMVTLNILHENQLFLANVRPDVTVLRLSFNFTAYAIPRNSNLNIQ